MATGSQLQGAGTKDSTIAGDSIIQTFDAAGRLLSAKRSDAEIVRTYNREGTVRTDSQLVRSTPGGSVVSHVTLRYWTDAGDRRVKFFNGTDTLFYIYGHNALDSLLVVKWIASGEAPDTFEILWDSLGRRDSLVYHMPGVYVSYGYDVDGRQRMVCSRHPSNSSPQDYLEHQYLVTQISADGSPTAWTESSGGNAQSGTACLVALANSVGGATGMQYDGRHQMISDGALGAYTYHYDGSGNRLARHSVSDGSLVDSLVYTSGRNRVSQSIASDQTVAKTFVYDANGSTHEEQPTYYAGNWRLYYYDALGEML